MQLGDLPEGAKVTEKGFEWKPTNQQVGVEKVQVTLSFGDKQRVVEANFKVTQPFIDSPIEIGNFFVDEKAAQLICWSSSGIDEYGRASSVPGESSEPKPRIAVIPLRRGTEAHTLSHADPIKQVVSVGSRLAVLPANDTTRVEIYEVPAMKRIRTLVSAAPLVGISVEKDQLILQSESSTDVYQMSSLKRLRSIDSGRGVVGTNGSKRNASILKDGILSNELLIDPTTNEPILIISPGSIPALGGADARLYSGGFLRRDVNERSNARNDRNNGMTVVAGPTTIPNRSAKVALENDVNTFRPAGSVHTNWKKQSVSLRLSDSSSTLLERIPIVAELIPNSTEPILPPCQQCE